MTLPLQLPGKNTVRFLLATVSVLMFIGYVQDEISAQSSSVLKDILFTEFGGLENKLKLGKTSSATSVLFTLNGTTGDQTAGYVSQPLNIAPKVVFIDTWNTSKQSIDPSRNDTQVTLSFLVSGKNGISANVNYVMGPLKINGWFKGDLFESVKPGSTNVLNLQGLTSEDRYSIRSISIMAQSLSIINEVNFNLRFE